ncbi:MAG TPA: hypothetical protein VFJ43_18075 [Bacteroidia bacterium]|nr:hypothetical protein [Bacteroidia bacterium]
MKVVQCIVFLLSVQFAGIAQNKIDNLNGIEKMYVGHSDDFLMKIIGKERFETYIHFNSIWYYAERDSILTFPKSILDDSVTNVVIDYWLIIPEIKLGETIEITYTKSLDNWSIKDSSKIPKYILENKSRDLLDTSAIYQLLIKRNINKDKCKLSCAFNRDFNRFTYLVEEEIIPFNAEKGIITQNEYVIDALTGQFLSEDKNVEIISIPH